MNMAEDFKFKWEDFDTGEGFSNSDVTHTAAARIANEKLKEWLRRCPAVWETDLGVSLKHWHEKEERFFPNSQCAPIIGNKFGRFVVEK